MSDSNSSSTGGYSASSAKFTTCGLLPPPKVRVGAEGVLVRGFHMEEGALLAPALSCLLLGFWFSSAGLDPRAYGLLYSRREG